MSFLDIAWATFDGGSTYRSKYCSVVHTGAGNWEIHLVRSMPAGTYVAFHNMDGVAGNDNSMIISDFDDTTKTINLVTDAGGAPVESDFAWSIAFIPLT